MFQVIVVGFQTNYPRIQRGHCINKQVIKNFRSVNYPGTEQRVSSESVLVSSKGNTNKEKGADNSMRKI